jgi:hypothetical protein
MKRHYEVMRVMRMKVLDPRELWYGIKSISVVQDAIRYRTNDLTSMSVTLYTATRHADPINACRYLFSADI